MTLAQRWCLMKARSKRNRLGAFLKNPGSVLDVGCGNGALAHLLQKDGVQIETVDIVNKSIFEDLQPQVYDGKNFPFPDKSFDTVMLITMLHHTPDPEAVLREAARVGKKVIIMEDVYRNRAQKQLTFFVDSLVNWEFKDHPHTNKSDQEWRQCFEKLGWKLIAFRKDRFLLFFTQTIYHLHPMKG